jgi:hypothetical protein
MDTDPLRVKVFTEPGEKTAFRFDADVSGVHLHDFAGIAELRALEFKTFFNFHGLFVLFDDVKICIFT